MTSDWPKFSSCCESNLFGDRDRVRRKAVIRKLLTTLVIGGLTARRHAVTHAAGANLLIIGLSTVAGIVVARSMGAEGRGYYAAIMAWFALAQVVGEVGQSGAVTYWVARDPDRGRHYVASSRVIMLAAGAVVSVAGFFGSYVLAQGNEAVTLAYQIAFLGCFLNSLCAATVYGLQSLSIKRWNIVRIVQPLAYLIVVGALSLFGVLNIVSLSVALIASIAIQFAAAMLQAGAVGLSAGSSGRLILRDLTRYGVAYAGSSVPATVSSQFDRLVLSRIAQPAQLGEYAVASTVAGLVFPFSTAVASVAFPRSAGAQVGESQRRDIERRAVLGTTLISGVLALIIGLAGAPLIPIVFGPSFGGAVGLVWWIMPSILFRSVSQVLGALLRGRDRPGLVTYGQVCGLAAGALVIVPLTAWMGIRGAAVAVSFGELIVFVFAFAMLSFVRRKARRGARSLEANPMTGQHLDAANLDGNLQ
ncbi:lipopolysaccharide biosynthesis protein [Cryobacterium sp. TMT2-23]|uniref:lipopolysaccharide biosynthesis protein n=1 Tax=Cryobacterium sp. TMT2-23 TaxID=1259252 RepID=UPI0021036572|nr:oligosaccharide flippase family protein [Cryobacterium sp. TMT2-23]